MLICKHLEDDRLEDCPECCKHSFDAEEGYTCLNCGKQGDIGKLIDATEDWIGDR
jgi:hypothetical protein